MNSISTIPAWMQPKEHESNMAKCLSEFRTQQWEAFQAQGLPTRKDERYKYADFSFLAKQSFQPGKMISAEEMKEAIYQHRLQRGESILLVFVNGNFMPELSDLHKLPKEVLVLSLSEALKNHKELIESHWRINMDSKKYPFASLNAAMCEDGLFFYLPEKMQLSTPVHLLSLVTHEEHMMANPYHMFVLEKQSRMTLVEEHYSQVNQAYFINLVTTIVMNESAHLNHYKLQQEGQQATHIAHTFVQQKQNSCVEFMNVSTGALFARDDFIVKLTEPGAECRTYGLYHLTGYNQYVDNHIDIDHEAPRSQSEMLFKGILDNKSRAVFNGRLHVEKDAQKILAYQANHNLLLSSEAEIYSKPELEIYADDVKCKHGATTGQLDQDALFYLRSRGISHQEALNMMLQGFAEEVTQKITQPAVKLRVLEMVTYA